MNYYYLSVITKILILAGAIFSEPYVYINWFKIYILKSNSPHLADSNPCPLAEVKGLNPVETWKVCHDFFGQTQICVSLLTFQSFR